MADKQVVTRPNQHITVEVNSVSSELKAKIKLAFLDVITKLKDKHLS
jgi:hypothetical protein